MTTAIVYTATGDHLLAGTNKGRLNIIDARTREIIYYEKIAAALSRPYDSPNRARTCLSTRRTG